MGFRVWVLGFKGLGLEGLEIGDCKEIRVQRLAGRQGLEAPMHWPETGEHVVL